jgi:hypothetical protein
MILLIAYDGPVYQDLVGFTYIDFIRSTSVVESPIFEYFDVIGDIWNNLTLVDSKRYVGSGWYSLSANTAFECALIQIAGLDFLSRKSSNEKINRLDLEPDTFSNISCNFI